jgi:hypothetical protein
MDIQINVHMVTSTPTLKCINKNSGKTTMAVAHASQPLPWPNKKVVKENNNIIKRVIS